MAPPVYFLIQGMHARADSIAYDTVFQHRTLERWGFRTAVFAETYSAENYPGIDAQPLEALEEAVRREPGPIVYHWVDGWERGDRFLLDANVPVVLRWHNNTPPWFFASYSSVPTHKTVRGFQELLHVAQALPEARIWTNSDFSRRQLGALGISEDRVDVVYPASTYLEADPDLGEPRALSGDRDPIRLLFVGRVVPHKGHLHLLTAARATADLSGRPVRVTLPGRPDGDMRRYIPEVRALAEQLDVEIDIPGEVTHEALERAYREADVFVGLSEHEGFGLPVLEAMTRGLPVVGYRSSAVSELLADHPLAVDDLDSVEIARRVVAALDPTARRALVGWQARAVLPRFAGDAIARQLGARVEALGLEAPRATEAQPVSSEPCPPEVEAALERAALLPPPSRELPSHLPRDQNPHFVTRYDLDAYRAMLQNSERGDLRGRALALQFGSHRPTLGGFMEKVKGGILRLQDGLIRTVELSHDDLENRIRDLSDRVDLLSSEIKTLRRQARKPPRND